MIKQPALVRKIYQKDNHSFAIEWNDGQMGIYKLSDLQKLCPCAACIDEQTGKRILDIATVKEDVRAIRITSVGRYALRIQFTSGCSNGIFDFDFLKKMV